MSNGQLNRLMYYTGQLLTSRDFEDQQEYHRNKLQQLTQRFPYGIVKGLNVICDLPKEPPDDFEAFKITEGFAVDEAGNAIVVGSEGLRIPIEEFYQNEPADKDHLFLSIRYTEKKRYSPASSHDSSTKNNRITESVEHRWDEGANRSVEGLVSHITLAKIRRREDNENIDNKKTCHNGELIIEEEIDNQMIRLNAGIVEEEQLSNDLKGKLVTGGDSHNHTAGHGEPIPESGLESGVQDQLVTGGNDHNHTGGDGAQIPEAGLAPEVADQLVTQGNHHDHTTGHGAPIPEAGLEAAVQDKLVNGGNAHDHSGTGGNHVPLTGLAVDVREKLVTIHTVAVDSGDSTIPADTQTATATINEVEKNAIIHIVPTQGVISWTFTVQPNGDFLTYVISVENTGHTEVAYEVRKFVFGAG